MAEINDTINLTKIKLSLGQFVFVVGLSVSMIATLATSLWQLRQVADLVARHEARIGVLERYDAEARAYERGRMDGLSSPERSANGR